MQTKYKKPLGDRSRTYVRKRVNDVCRVKLLLEKIDRMCIIANAMEFAQILQTQCAYVYDQLGPFAKEVHFQRALNINLLALGYTTDTEKCCSTVFRDLRGYLHTISSDRIDIYIHTLEGGYVLELKQADTLKPEYEQQARRYKRAL